MQTLAAMPVPGQEPTPAEAAIEKFKEARIRDRTAALTTYRKHVTKMADGTELTDREADALRQAATVLGVSDADLTADVAAITSHRNQENAIKATEQALTKADERLKTWNDEEEKLRARLRQIAYERQAYQQTHVNLGMIKAERDRIFTSHPRVFGDGATVIDPPPPKVEYVGRVIRSGDWV